MKILLITLGSRGDINPIICLGLALKNKGHEVTIISSEVYGAIVTASGLSFITCSTASEYHNVINNPDFYDAQKSFKVIAQYMLLDPMRRIYEIIANYDPANTVLVATQFMLGARIAHEKLGFPLVTVCLQPMSFWSEIEPPVYPGGSLQKLPAFLKKIMLRITDRFLMDKTLSPQVNQFRQELGLMPVNKIYSRWMFSPQKIIGFFPVWFTAPAPDWPKQTELTGFLHYDENANQVIPKEVIQFLSAGNPPLIMTYGTSTTQCEAFFRIFVEAARRLEQRVLILTQHGNQLPELNPDMEMHIPYISLQKILPHSAAIIHHGGIGTLSQALTAATPQLIVPLVNDQFDNAYRLEKLGAGLSLIAKKYSVDDAMNKIQELLRSTAIKSNCLFYSKKINSSRYEQQVCRIIENC